jgi:4-amino-4-deoxy-L-arabinose transferase-like glycosyltransferase
MMKKEKFFWIILGLSLLWFVFYLYLTPYDLSPDEAYYWTWSKRLSLGYYSKPPMVAFLIRLGTLIGGDKAIFVRLFAPILWALSSLCFFYWARGLFGVEVAFKAFLLSLFTLLTPLMGFFMTIDAPLVFFWSLTLFLFSLALKKGKPLYFYLMGLSFGLGLLSKYTMAILGVSLFLYLLFTPSLRPYLKKKEPYLGFLLALGVFLPHFLWESKYGFIAFRHTASLLKKGSSFDPLSFVTFIGSQFLLLTPLTFFLFLKGLWRTFKESLEGDFSYGLPFWASSLLFLVCCLKSLFGPCYANWGAPAYVGGLILASRTENRRLLFLSILIGAFFIGLAYNAESLRRFSHLSPEDFPTSRLLGWRELGEEVKSLRKALGAPFILGTNRNILSEVAFYGEAFPRIYQYGGKESQFDLWGGLEREKGKDALIVLRSNKKLPSDFEKSFSQCTFLKEFEVVKKGVRIKSFSLYLCKDFKGL